jgi:hypothetical protein
MSGSVGPDRSPATTRPYVERSRERSANRPDSVVAAVDDFAYPNTKGPTMHIAKEDIPVKIDAPGAVARQLPDFGTAAGALGAEYFTMDAGTDLAPLLEGLDGDMCHGPHWGFMLAGRVVVTYRDGSTEQCVTGDVFHWPAGHSVRVEQDAQLIMFSPQAEHTEVLDHILAKLA